MIDIIPAVVSSLFTGGLLLFIIKGLSTRVSKVETDIEREIARLRKVYRSIETCVERHDAVKESLKLGSERFERTDEQIKDFMLSQKEILDAIHGMKTELAVLNQVIIQLKAESA